MPKPEPLAWLLTAMATMAALSLAASPARPQSFAGSAEVVEVEIPVQVTRDGQPVKGLTAADFEVSDGRRKLPVAGFRVVDLAAPGGAPHGAPAPAGRRQLLLLFDLAFAEPKGVVAAREAARGLVLRGIRPGDLVGVATYSSQRGPQILLGFTSDRRQVDAALDSLGMVRDDRASDPLRLVMARAAGGGGAQGGQTAERPRETIVAGDDALLAALGTQQGNLNRESNRSAQKAAVTALTRAYAELARVLGSLPGRKQVIYFSEGFDGSVLTGGPRAAASPSSGGIGSDADLQNQDAMQRDRANQEVYLSDSQESFGSSESLNGLERMLEEFRRADCVIQAVDVGGLRAGADSQGKGRDALLAMARGTGGELFEKTNDLAGALGALLARTSVTYVLAVQGEAAKPGAWHKLKVELKDAPRGTRVAYRAGYYEPKPFGQLNPLERLFDASARLMGGAEAGTVPGAVLAAPFRAGGAGGDRAYVPVLIEADGPALLGANAARPADTGSLPVEVYAYALDASGGIQDYFFQSLGLDLAKAGPMLRQGGLRFFGHLELPPGEYSVRTLVRNGASGAFSLRAAALTVPDFGKGAALLPPLFPDPAAARWLVVREAPRGEQAAAAYPFMARQQPYVPSSRPVFVAGGAGKEAPMALVGYGLGAGDLKAAAQVLDAAGKEVAGGQVRVIQREAAAAGEPDRLIAAFRPPSLPPGEYVLRITLTGAAGPVGASSAPFVVAGAH